MEINVNQPNDDPVKIKTIQTIKPVHPLNHEKDIQNPKVTDVISKVIGTNPVSRQSLNRLAKSRHSFLSKGNFMTQRNDNPAKTKTRKPKKPVNPLSLEKNTQNSVVTDVLSKAIGTNSEPRQSLTRLAKSRHSFLSKNVSGDNNTKLINITAKIIPRKEEKFVGNIFQNKKKLREIVCKNKCKDIIHKNKQEKILIKKKATKKFEINKHSLLTKDSYKNNICLVCGKGHAELACKNKKCHRVFHLCCLNKSKLGKTGFICPSHFCYICKKRKIVDKCKFCIKSFCIDHVEGNIFKDPIDDELLCTTHYQNKELNSNESYSTVVIPNAVRKLSNTTVKKVETFVTASNTPIYAIKSLTEVSNLHDIADDLLQSPDTITGKDYMLTHVVKDESDREFIHIGGFNVSTVSNLDVESKSNLFTSVNTDGDMLKPSSASVVTDIESASAFYQPIDSLNLLSFECENIASHDHIHVHYEPEIKSDWLAHIEL